MKIEVARVDADDVHPLRELYRREMHCQIVHDSFLGRGFSEAYLLRVDGRVAGYGLVAMRHYPNTVNEFHVLPEFRGDALPLLRALLETSEASRLRVQTNDPLALLLLYDCATEIESEIILFADAGTTQLPSPGGVLRAVTPADAEQIAERHYQWGGDWLIELNGVVVAMGGVACHYNPPYGDLYMGVDEAYRNRGYGSYVVQEMKRIAYEMGKTPAARCNATNTASRKTLERAGMLPSGRILDGKVAR